MRHIKLFEGFSDPYYQEIDYLVWEDFESQLRDYSINGGQKTFHDFPESQFLKLRKRNSNKTGIWFLTNKPEYKHGYTFNPSHTGIMWINNVVVDNQHNYINIWLRDDDWYWVKWDYDTDGFRQRPKTEYYRCDQFEGLEQLLKNRKIIV